ASLGPAATGAAECRVGRPGRGGPPRRQRALLRGAGGGGGGPRGGARVAGGGISGGGGGGARGGGWGLRAPAGLGRGPTRRSRGTLARTGVSIPCRSVTLAMPQPWQPPCISTYTTSSLTSSSTTKPPCEATAGLMSRSMTSCTACALGSAHAALGLSILKPL